MPDLTGKTALVTGASRGIGRAIAHTLARHGAFVLVHGRQPGGEADEVARAIQAEGGAAVCVHAELLDDDGPEQLVRQVETVLSARGGDLLVDVLVNNAGVIRREPIEAVTRAEFDRTLGVNLRAPFFLIQQMLPRLRDGGRIVNISSMGTRVAYPAMAAYAPAKAGIEALTRLLAVHLGSRGITVNAVSPGLTETAMNPVKPGTPAADQVIATIALGRLGKPADIADVVAFVASDEARWITGQCIEVSGGQRL